LSDRVQVFVGLEKGASLTEREISDRIRARVRVTLDVAIVPADEVHGHTRVEGRRKPVLVFDHRTRDETSSL